MPSGVAAKGGHRADRCLRRQQRPRSHRWPRCRLRQASALRHRPGPHPHRPGHPRRPRRRGPKRFRPPAPLHHRRRRHVRQARRQGQPHRRSRLQGHSDALSALADRRRRAGAKGLRARPDRPRPAPRRPCRHPRRRPQARRLRQHPPRPARPDPRPVEERRQRLLQARQAREPPGPLRHPARRHRPPGPPPHPRHLAPWRERNGRRALRRAADPLHRGRRLPSPPGPRRRRPPRCRCPLSCRIRRSLETGRRHRPLTAMKPTIEHLALARLIPYARNSRTHRPAQIGRVAASIREFGFSTPVLSDVAGGIIAGHGRVVAARQLGLAEVPCIRLAHLTEAQKRAYVIADNKLALNAGWDHELLALEFKDLAARDYDLDLTGFGEDEIGKLLAELDATPEGQADADEVPEPLPEAISQPGDIWLLGRHRLMCGDSTKSETLAALHDGQHADMVFTDPPYWVAYEDTNAGKASKASKARKKSHIANDALSDDAQAAFWLAAFRAIAAHIKAGAPYYLCSPQGGRMMMMMMMRSEERR